MHVPRLSKHLPVEYILRSGVKVGQHKVVYRMPVSALDHLSLPTIDVVGRK